MEKNSVNDSVLLRTIEDLDTNGDHVNVHKPHTVVTVAELSSVNLTCNHSPKNEFVRCSANSSPFPDLRFCCAFDPSAGTKSTIFILTRCS